MVGLNIYATNQSEYHDKEKRSILEEESGTLISKQLMEPELASLRIILKKVCALLKIVMAEERAINKRVQDGTVRGREDTAALLEQKYEVGPERG